MEGVTCRRSQHAHVRLLSDARHRCGLPQLRPEGAETARRIADAQRGFGVEVWFDQSERRGGDQWDAKIRRQIKECALFLPVISASTNARAEGYFRLEWKLAVERSHLLADDRSFLFPVVIDAPPDAAGATLLPRFRRRLQT